MQKLRTCLQPILFSLLALAAALCIFNAYSVGRANDLDAKINYGSFNDMTAMTIAISENIYHFHHGYVGRPEILTAIAHFLAPSGAMAANDTHMMLAQNRTAIESALQAAIKLDPKSFVPFHGLKPPFIMLMAEDTGLVDFYRLSFNLFGYHAEAMYQCYFLLLSLSALLLLIQARRSLWAAALLVALLYGFNGLFYIDTFSDYGAPSIYSNRLIGTLSLIATLHIMLFLRIPNRYTPVTDWLLAFLQIMLLLFVITIRSGSQWQWLAILCWLSIPVLYYYFKHRKQGNLVTKLSGLWRHKAAAITLLAVMCYTQTAFDRERMDAHDSVYFSECNMPHHLRWHSAYIGLGWHPKWEDYVPSEANGVLHGDGLAWNVAASYWRRKHDTLHYVCKLFPEFPPFGAHDAIMRKAFFKFAGANPGYIAELYFFYKPAAIIRGINTSLTLLPAWWWYYMSGFCVFMGIAALFFGTAQAWAGAAAISLLLFTSNAPAIFAYPVYPAETLMLTLATIAYLPALCVGSLAAFTGRLLRLQHHR